MTARIVVTVVFYRVLALAVLVLHLAFIAWVVFGVAVTRGRPLLRWFHLLMLAWAVVVEIGPWPCPLTVAENWLDVRGGYSAYHNGFMLHYLDKIVYPNVSPNLLTGVALAVVLVNLAIYAARFRQRRLAGW